MTDFTLEHIDEKWHVCRGDIVFSPGYRFKEMAERELTLKQTEEYRILVSVEDAYHPQWRWSPEWMFVHFQRKGKNEYAIFKTLPEAQQFMAQQCINAYEIVQEDRSQKEQA